MKNEGLGGTVVQTVELWNQGMNVAQIAKARGVIESTIMSHLAAAVDTGRLRVHPRDFYSEEQEKRIIAALPKFDGTSLGTLYGALDGEVGYGALRMFLAINKQE